MKKLLSFLFLAALMLPAIPDKEVKANSYDVTYSFSVSANVSSYGLSSFRPKDTSTSVYIKPYYMDGSLTKAYVKVFGAANNNGASQADCTNYYRTYYYNNTVNFINQEFELYNTVYENPQYTHVTIGVRGAIGSGVTKGKWSADTVGSFPQMPYQ